MGESDANTGDTEGLAMLETFASVGAMRFDMTWTNAAGDKQRFRRGVPLATLTRILPAILADAERRQHNVIVRPDGPGVTFIQLDDLKAPALAQLAPPVFLILETSPGNHQAWVAIEGEEDKEFARRLRKGTGADATASGATRVAGSVNFKDKYAPGFPRVTMRAAQPGRRTTPAELERLGLVASPEELPPLPPRPARVSPGNRRWPSYARCVEGAPMNSEESGPDISRADYTFCMIAISWGWTADEAADRLMEESAKAQKKGSPHDLSKTAR